MKYNNYAGKCVPHDEAVGIRGRARADLENAGSVGHQARLVQGGLPVREYDISIVDMPVHNLASHALASPAVVDHRPLSRQQLLSNCLPFLQFRLLVSQIKAYF